MDKIKNSFSIQDLEILSGIKAHTIRIWEKRYGLFNPDRINRNIRIYDLEDLQKLLNISTLYFNNYKISKLAELTDKQLIEETKLIALSKIPNNYHINTLIICMYTFDENLFEEIYLQLIEHSEFDHVFVNTYSPLLNHIGILWQTEAIKPAHEHFISNLIYQKILLNTALLESPSKSNNEIYILFLPEGEIHEIGLLFLNYHLKQQGKKTIYLGRDIPIDNLSTINSQFNDIIWISYFLINKSIEEKKKFIKKFEYLLAHTKNTCLIIGEIWDEFSISNENKQIIFHRNLKDIIV